MGVFRNVYNNTGSTPTKKHPPLPYLGVGAPPVGNRGAATPNILGKAQDSTVMTSVHIRTCNYLKQFHMHNISFCFLKDVSLFCWVIGTPVLEVSEDEQDMGQVGRMQPAMGNQLNKSIRSKFDLNFNSSKKIRCRGKIILNCILFSNTGPQLVSTCTAIGARNG